MIDQRTEKGNVEAVVRCGNRFASLYSELLEEENCDEVISAVCIFAGTALGRMIGPEKTDQRELFKILMLNAIDKRIQIEIDRVIAEQKEVT